MFDKAMAEAGVDRSRAYVTNAVKHFKFEQRGKRRIHAKPGAGEIRLCIAQIDKLKYLVATCYGWGQELNNFRDMVMTLAPIKTAYTLDGGLSASLVFMNNKFNNVQGGSERAITDIIYFASAWDLYGESK
jgi:hypothetical protein